MAALKTIALIPARSGSKGLIGKNLRLLGDDPLIAHTIMAAKDSQCFDHIIVSTDCEEIANVAKRYGATLPPSGLRPSNLAEDTSSVLDVVRLVCDEMTRHLNVEDIELVLLQPTSPLRDASLIKNAVAFKATLPTNASVVSVTKAKPISWQGSITDTGELTLHQGQMLESNNRQQLSKNVIINGAIYCATASRLKTLGFTETPVFAFEMDEERSIDIDTLLDFEIASYLYAVL